MKNIELHATIEVQPKEIESKSFAIITELLGDIELDAMQAPIIKRVIHTSADFDYAENLYFSEGVVQTLLQAMQNGADIVTDTQMAKAGINKTALAKFGGTVHCFMADEDVAVKAKERGITRAMVSMEKASQMAKPVIFAIGNAPTALIRLQELIAQGKMNPVAIIAVPVGFVNVVESKEDIMKGPAPCIVAKGRKGGSNIAAAICNALLYML